MDRPAEGEAADLDLKPRRRIAKKKRRRLAVPAAAAADVALGDEEAEATSAADVQLLREAQRLRDAARRTQRKAAPTASPPADAAADANSGFATERATHIETERMARFVDQRMQERFGAGGDKREEESHDVAKRWEEELYAVPQHLQVEQRELYDPAAGLPAGGVEEVALDGSPQGAARAKRSVRRRG